MNKGKLIVIEGSCDGIGKSTQYNRLYDHLKSDGYELVKHHFPSYDTYQGAPVEKYLKGSFGQPSELSPYFINSLYALDRAITWYSEFKEFYDQGKIILLDRYTTSSIIYQSALIEDENKKKDFINYVTDFEYNKLKIKEPDEVIFLHAPFDLVTKLRNMRKENDGVINDIHESNIEFMKKVYDNAMFVANYLNWNMIKCNNNNDEMKSIDEIHDEVYKKVRSKN